jgi:hypothetical protein
MNVGDTDEVPSARNRDARLQRNELRSRSCRECDTRLVLDFAQDVMDGELDCTKIEWILVQRSDAQSTETGHD